jgi:FMN-dependent NADH-azoreductase
MNVLHICANPKPAGESVSKQLSIAFISALVESNPDAEINNIDLYQEPPPYLSNEMFRALWKPIFDPGFKPTAKEEKSAEYAQFHAEMFNAADVLILTMPMWNFGAPAIMKAWIDQIMTPGLTFKLGPNGVEPMHRLRKVVLLVSSGGVYKEGDPRDALSAQIRAAFDFIKVNDFTVAWADGQTAMFFGDHEERKQTAIEAAQEDAQELAAEMAATAAVPAAPAPA